MDSRSRLLASGSFRSPSRTTYRRRSSIDRALDLLGGATSTAPSLASRLCRPLPLVVIVLVLSVGAVIVYFAQEAVQAKALELHDALTQQVLDQSHFASEKIYDVLVNTTDVVTDAITPVAALGETKNNTKA